MANQGHLNILKRGVGVWNEWRQKNPDIKPNLRGADLRKLPLKKADFINADLRGANLREATLEKADFTNADIRGTNFKKTILKKAKFNNAKAGLRFRYFALFYIISLVFCSPILGIISLSPSIIVLSVLKELKIENVIIQASVISVFFGVILVISIITIRRGNFLRWAKMVSVGLIVCTAYLWIGSEQGAKGVDEGGIPLIILIEIVLFIFAELVLRSWAVAVAGAIAVAVAEIIAIAVAVAEIIAINMPIPIELARAWSAICMIIIYFYIVWRMRGEDEQFLLKPCLLVASIGGTNFQDADLTEAQFSKAILKNSSFNEKTSIIRTDWRDAKKLEFAYVVGTILENRFIRELLVTGKTQVSSFAGINLKSAYLAGINFDNKNFTEADLSGSTLENASLKNVNLSKVQASSVNFRGANLTGSNLEEANLSRAIFENTCLKKANLNKVQAQSVEFKGADLHGTDFRNADLRFATFSNVKISGIKLYAASYEGWILDVVECDYVYLDKEGIEKYPKDREFRSGEFEERYKTLPTIEYYFEHGFTPIDTVIMNKVVQTINETHPEFELRLNNFQSGSQPHAVFTVIHKEYADEALKKITDGYEHKFKELEEKFANFYNQLNEPKLISQIIDLISQIIDRPDKESTISINALGDGIFVTGRSRVETKK